MPDDKECYTCRYYFASPAAVDGYCYFALHTVSDEQRRVSGMYVPPLTIRPRVRPDDTCGSWA